MASGDMVRNVRFGSLPCQTGANESKRKAAAVNENLWEDKALDEPWNLSAQKISRLVRSLALSTLNLNLTLNLLSDDFRCDAFQGE